MMRGLAIMFRKEWREFVRDRRTLFLTCVMPLVFYPAAMGAFGYLGSEQNRSLREAPLRVGVVGAGLGHLWQSAGGEGKLQEYASMQAGQGDLRAGRVDVILEGSQTASGWNVAMHLWGTADREVVQKRAREQLAGIEKFLIHANLARAGIPVSAVEPLQVTEFDGAPVREAIGSKVGGVVAYFLIFLAFTGCMATAVDVVAGEKERGTLEAVLATPVDVRLLMVAKLGFVSLTGMLSALCSLAGLAAVGLLGTAPDVRAGVREILDANTLAAVFALVLVATVLFAAVMLNLSLAARSAKEAQSWTSPVFLLVSLVLIYAMLPGIDANGGMRWVPVVNISLAVREAFCGTLSALLFVTAIGETLLLGALAILIGGRLARSEDALFRAA